MGTESHLKEMIEKYPHATLYYCLKLRVNYLKLIKFENIKLPGHLIFKSFSPSYKGFKDTNFQSLVESKLEPYKFRGIDFTRFDFGIHRLHGYLDLFKSTDEEIKTLLTKEKIWHRYESSVILHKYGHYSKDYARNKYGKENITLDQYEDLLNDLDGLSAFVERKEAPYREMIQKYGDAVNEFEKLHPEIPHSEYEAYNNEISSLASEGRNVLYHKYQNELTKRIKESFSSNKAPNLITWTNDTTMIDFNHDKKSANINWCTIFSKRIYKDVIYHKNAINTYKKEYPLCYDFFFDINEEKKSSAIMHFLSAYLPEIVRIYQSKFVELCIVIETDLEDSKVTPERILNVLKTADVNTKDIKIIDEYTFRYYHLKHLPYLIVSSVESEDSLRNKAEELINNEIIFSFLPIYYSINYCDLISINQQRIDAENQNRIRSINALKSTYPNGFYAFCETHKLNVNNLLSYYSILKSGEYDMVLLERQHKESQIVHKAMQIIQQYPNASKDDGYTESSEITYFQAEQIISNESKWKEIEQIFYNRSRVFNTGITISGIPHKYFHRYYPENRFPNSLISSEDRDNRQLIWMFKDGSSYATTKVAELVSNYLSSIAELKPIKERTTFICAPASSNRTYVHRFGRFSETVASNLGFHNGSKSLDIVSRTQSKHNGGSGEIIYEFDEEAIRDRYVIIFDDIVTSGTTALNFANKIEAAGGKVLAIISIGQTV